MDRSDDILSQRNTRGDRLIIFRQLQQAIEAMHRPEEVLQWLASLIVQRFDVAIVQFWTCASRLQGQPSAQLRAMAGQSSFQPAYLAGDKVAITIEQIARGQHTSPAQPVEQVFPLYLASLLQRYGLSYCAYCSVDRNVRFVSGEDTLPQDTSMGLIFVALLLFQRYPDHSLISTVGAVLEQALVLAERHGLLLPVSSGPLLAPQDAFSQEPLSVLSHLVPRRKQVAGLMLSSNPFAKSITISDKQALRLYEAIDGQLTVGQVCRRIGMTLDEAHIALQVLLGLQCIELFTQEGEPVDADILFKNS